MKKHLIFITAVISGSLLLACSSSDNFSTPSTNGDRDSSSPYYTTAYPQRNISAQLERARESIVRIVSTSFYNSYTFNKPFLTLSDIKTNNLRTIATDFFSTEESTAGTAILLEKNKSNVMLITCDHVVASPDTAITYYEGENIPEDTFVKSINIKRKQNNWLFTDQDLYNFDILASDERFDLALLTTTYNNKEELPQRPLNITTGKSDKLRMGSVLYVLGYPRGYPMVTRGLASTSKKRYSHFFITDALFNPGISGGLVLASRDNYRSFQWVGMARSASASKEDVLVPRPVADKYGRAAKPYTQTPYVQQKTRISYGITQTIPINTIKDFLDKHEQKISQSGFTLR